jgi:hypothetical protein
MGHKLSANVSNITNYLHPKMSACVWGTGKITVKVIEFHPPLSHVGSASPHILHHRPAFNIVRPVERLVDLLR